MALTEQDLTQLRQMLWGEFEAWWADRKKEWKEEQLALTREFIASFMGGEDNPLHQQIALMKRQAEALEGVRVALQEFVSLQKGK